MVITVIVNPGRCLLSTLAFVLVLGLLGSVVYGADRELTDDMAVLAAQAFSTEGLYLLKEGVRAYQISSFDRTGGNDDGNRRWAYLDFDRTTRVFTIFEATGPGTLRRFWKTGWLNAETLRFYVDDEPLPRFDLPVEAFFSGEVAPFLAPLVGDETVSSGGFFSYYPHQFTSRLRIETESVSRYIQFTYHLYADREAQQALTAQPAPLPMVALDTLIAVTPELAPKERADVLDIGASGLVQELTLRLPHGIVQPTPYHEALLHHLYLSVRVDDALDPQIYAPLSEFFGGTVFGEPIEAVPVTVEMVEDQLVLRQRLPMPVGSRMTIGLENRSERVVPPINFEVVLATVPEMAALLASGRAGHLYATHRRDSELELGRDFIALDVTGSGHVVGVVLMASSDDPANRRILEGDERIFIDGAASPQLHGTGTEDFFNGGWYYSFGPFTRELHGHPAHIVDAAGDHTTQYRFLIPDYLPFYKSIRLGFEHGPVNDKFGTFSSTVFWYGSPEVRLVLTDTLDVGSADSEAAHGYQVGASELLEGRYPYIGVDQPVPVTDVGRRIEGFERFVVRVAEDHTGVLLRRRTDLKTPNQRAEVFVNGVYAGEWLTPGFHTDHGFVDSEFQLPRALTRGRERLEIEIRPLSGWNAFRYEVFSYRP